MGRARGWRRGREGSAREPVESSRIVGNKARVLKNKAGLKPQGGECVFSVVFSRMTEGYFFSSMSAFGSGCRALVWSVRGNVVMAKPSRIAVRLVSEEGSGSFYIARKNPTQKPEKMAVRKYDARLRKHVLFREQKMK